MRWWCQGCLIESTRCFQCLWLELRKSWSIKESTIFWKQFSKMCYPRHKTNQGKLQIKCKWSNIAKIEQVTLNITLPLLIVKIENPMTENWLSGLFYIVLEILNYKYCSKDRLSRIIQEQKLMTLKLKGNEDPDFLEQTSCLSKLDISTTWQENIRPQR